jgi:hypothetical protein
MARKKTVVPAVEEPAAFQPKRIDDYAVQISPELVKIEGIDEPVSLEEYLANQEQELDAAKVLEGQLYADVKAHIRRHLPIRTGTWQEDCRKLSWAYAASGDMKLLKQVVTACPSMALVRPKDSVVSAHHLSHFIRAFLATVSDLPPLDRAQAAACIVYPAKDEGEALQLRIIVWKHLLQLLRPEQRSAPLTKKTGILSQILEHQQLILQRLDAIEQSLVSRKKV